MWEVRRALTHAVDRQQIIDALFAGYARRSTSPILSSAWAHDATIEPWEHDPAEARRLLAAHGFADTDGDGTLERGGEPFSFELLINAGDRGQTDAATMIQEQLRGLGVEVRLRALEFNTWVERVLSRDFDAAMGGWNIDTSLNVGYAFHSDSIGEGGYNFCGYSNPEVDRLIDEANRAVGVEDKRELLHRLQALLHDDQPYTFLWEPQKINARNRRIRDSRPNALSSFYNLAEWWVSD